MMVEKSAITQAGQQLLRMVAYFDVFEHPLRFSEVEQLTAHPRATVEQLVTDYPHLFERNADFVWLKGTSPDWSVITQKRARAVVKWPKALKHGSQLAQLPFVKGVLLTGSMSKGAISEDGDFDFLLIVETHRVWLVKSIIEAFRKAMPQPWRECYCANYIVGMDTLALRHRNVFTAVELSTAIPLFGAEACRAFVEANAWAAQFVSNQKFVLERAAIVPSKPIGSSSNAMLEALDSHSLRLWNRYWERKYKHLPDAVRQKRFRRERGKAANHLHDFQDRVIDALEMRLQHFGHQEPLVL
ncbi:MAG: hypothetical protein VX026_00740 [Myxococcota bacterium]|nr:hypothetical protein [Myxococcota bacterium]